VRYLRVRRSIEWGALSERQTDRWGRSWQPQRRGQLEQQRAAAAGHSNEDSWSGSGQPQRGQLERQRAAATRTAGAAAGRSSEDSWSSSGLQQRAWTSGAGRSSEDSWSGSATSGGALEDGPLGTPWGARGSSGNGDSLGAGAMAAIAGAERRGTAAEGRLRAGPRLVPISPGPLRSGAAERMRSCGPGSYRGGGYTLIHPLLLSGYEPRL
jgi:hypothetical protein